MKISPAIPTRTVTIVVMLVRLDPGMVLPPLFREMRSLLGEKRVSWRRPIASGGGLRAQTRGWRARGRIRPRFRGRRGDPDGPSAVLVTSRLASCDRSWRGFLGIGDVGVSGPGPTQTPPAGLPCEAGPLPLR